MGLYVGNLQVSLSWGCMLASDRYWVCSTELGVQSMLETNRPSDWGLLDRACACWRPTDLVRLVRLGLVCSKPTGLSLNCASFCAELGALCWQLRSLSGKLCAVCWQPQVWCCMQATYRSYGEFGVAWWQLTCLKLLDGVWGCVLATHRQKLGACWIGLWAVLGTYGFDGLGL